MAGTAADTRLDRACAAIDRLNAGDPRQEQADGVLRPREIVYAERLSAGLLQLYPAASDLLRLAARAQHVCRWQIPRAQYADGRDGYNAWRAACRAHHVRLTSDVLRACEYSEADIAHVSKLIRKEHLKRDPESQALENAVVVVFVRHELPAFMVAHAADGDDKLIGILRKTLRKVDAVGLAAVLALTVPEATARLLRAAAA